MTDPVGPAQNVSSAPDDSRTDIQTVIVGHGESANPLIALLERLRPALDRFESPVYLVGGVVRDLIANRSIHDVDFVTAGDSLRLARKLADVTGGAYFAMDVDHGVGRALFVDEQTGMRWTLDVAAQRGETLADDLRARDFTMNAIAIGLKKAGESETPAPGAVRAVFPDAVLIDPLGGQADLKAKRLRQCSPESFSADPLRVLRAIRLANAFKLLIEPETRAALGRARGELNTVSIERRRDELLRILEGPGPHAALRTLDTLGILERIIPEVAPMRGVGQRPPHVYDVWEHTLKTIEALETVLAIISPRRTDETAADGIYGMIVYRLDRYRPLLQKHIAARWPNDRDHRSLLMLAALFHDCGKPATRTIDEAGTAHFYLHEQVGADLARERSAELRLSNEEATRIYEIVLGHMRPLFLGFNAANAQPTANVAEARSVDLIGMQPLTRRSIHRFWDATGPAGVDICLLTQADYVATFSHTIQLRPWLRHLDIVAQLLEAYFFEHDRVVAPDGLLDGNDLKAKFGLASGPLIGVLLRRLIEAQATGEVATRDQAVGFISRALEDPAFSGPSDD